MVVSDSAPLVLGSASPRRRDILEGLGIPIRVVPADVDEARLPGELPAAYLARVVADKLAEVARRVLEPRAVPGILVADTIVVVEGEILGKPKDVAEARVLLSKIVGRTHVVATRFAISSSADLGRAHLARTVETRVTLRVATADVVRRYAATGEGLDKAGAYAAQGIGTFLVERIDGSFSNVVGLPSCEVVLALLELGLLGEFPRTPG